MTRHGAMAEIGVASLTDGTARCRGDGAVLQTINELDRVGKVPSAWPRSAARSPA